VKKRARAARAMVTRVVGDEEGGGNGGNMARNNNDGLIPVVMQQAVLYSASASIDTWATTSRPDDDWRTRSARTMSATTERRRTNCMGDKCDILRVKNTRVRN